MTGISQIKKKIMKYNDLFDRLSKEFDKYSLVHLGSVCSLKS